jgi:SET domain-containing protein
MLHPDTKLITSPIEGKGVVATKLIPRGTIIWRHDPSDKMRRYTRAQYDAFSPKYQKTIDRYAYTEDDGTLVYSLDDDRFWNHSCDANTLNAPGHDMCIVVRDIHPGEELGYDYGLNLRPDLTIQCRCGAKNCRKLVKRLDQGSKLYKELEQKGAEAARLMKKVPQPLLHG